MLFGYRIKRRKFGLDLIGGKFAIRIFFGVRFDTRCVNMGVIVAYHKAFEAESAFEYVCEHEIVFVHGKLVYAVKGCHYGKRTGINCGFVRLKRRKQGVLNVFFICHII